MLHKYEIEVNKSNYLKDNDVLNCSMELSFLNNLSRENLITEEEYQEIKRRILKDYKLLQEHLLMEEKAERQYMIQIIMSQLMEKNISKKVLRHQLVISMISY